MSAFSKSKPILDLRAFQQRSRAPLATVLYANCCITNYKELCQRGQAEIKIGTEHKTGNLIGVNACKICTCFVTFSFQTKCMTQKGDTCFHTHILKSNTELRVHVISHTGQSNPCKRTFLLDYFVTERRISTVYLVIVAVKSCHIVL